MLTYYEFFAGGGMARAGLGPHWHCLLANDFDPRKTEIYRRNWGGGEMIEADVRALSTADMPGTPDLVWASFPCQDLSLAGAGAGLGGERSGSFWPFWDHMGALIRDRRKPRAIVLENVCGALTARGGADFAAIAERVAAAGYRVGALVIDAALFVPQSRKRLFIIAIDADASADPDLFRAEPQAVWCPDALWKAHNRLSPAAKEGWVWWHLRQPRARTIGLSDVLEDDPSDVRWHTRAETQKLLSMMSAVNRDKVRRAARSGETFVGTLYRRTRMSAAGEKIQRAEVRFDHLAGCLRTPAGGSSRQLVMIVHGRNIRTRLLSAREAARLMGLGEEYRLPARYNDAYHLVGDGVVVPVVRHIAAHILEPALARKVRASVKRSAAA